MRTDEINEKIGARVYAYFIDNKFIREKYLEEIKKLSPEDLLNRCLGKCVEFIKNSLYIGLS